MRAIAVFCHSADTERDTGEEGHSGGSRGGGLVHCPYHILLEGALLALNTVLEGDLQQGRTGLGKDEVDPLRGGGTRLWGRRTRAAGRQRERWPKEPPVHRVPTGMSGSE